MIPIGIGPRIDALRPVLVDAGRERIEPRRDASGEDAVEALEVLAQLLA